jgi:hypothetical protein
LVVQKDSPSASVPGSWAPTARRACAWARGLVMIGEGVLLLRVREDGVVGGTGPPHHLAGAGGPQEATTGGCGHAGFQLWQYQDQWSTQCITVSHRVLRNTSLQSVKLRRFLARATRTLGVNVLHKCLCSSARAARKRDTARGSGCTCGMWTCTHTGCRGHPAPPAPCPCRSRTAAAAGCTAWCTRCGTRTHRKGPVASPV